MSKARYLTVAFILVTAITVALLVTTRAVVPWSGDEALYAMHAGNIALGQPYAITPYLFNPQNAIHPAAAPPGLPLLLAPAYHWFGLNWFAFQVEDLVFFALFLMALAVLARHWLPPMLALLAVVVMGVHPLIWEMKETVPSEFPFLFFLYGALVLVDRCPVDDLRRRRWFVAGAALMLAAACLVRPVGIVVFPAIVLASVYRDRKLITPATIAAGAGALLFYVLQQPFRPDLGTYVNYMDGLSLHSIRSNLFSYELAYRYFLEDHPYYSTWEGHALAAIVLALAGVGFVERLRRGVTAFELFTLGYCAFLVIYPVSLEPDRYSLPVWPMALLYAFVGSNKIALLIGERWRYIPASVLSLVLFTNYALAYEEIEPRLPHVSITAEPSQAVFQEIRKVVPANGVVITRKPTIVALYTDRKSSIFPMHATDDQFFAYMRSVGARYILQDLGDFAGAKPEDTLNGFIDRNGSSLHLIYSTPLFRLFRLESGSRLDSTSTSRVALAQRSQVYRRARSKPFARC
jgi:hypothetical protein